MNSKDNWELPEPRISKSKSKNGLFVAEFQYYKADGTKGHTNTRSFTTEKRAIKMAKALQEESANKKRKGITKLSDKTIEQAIDDYVDYLDNLISIQTTKKASKFKGYQDDIKSLKNNHTPNDLLNTKIRELEDDDFKLWIKHINEKDIKGSISGLSGSRVWSYRKTINKFIEFLNKNEYFIFDKNLADNLHKHMYEYKIKPKDEGKREDVYVPTYLDINIFCSGYKRDTFLSDYCYCLYKILFFSGIRICEIISLRWKDVDFNSGLIHIDNSINQKELRSNVMYRINKGVGKTKNDKSKRYIPMMEVYYKLFKNYKRNYQKHFKLNDTYMDLAFCFPKLQSRYKDKDDFGPFVYQSQKWIRAEIERQCDETGIPYFPAESLRHACAKFIAKDLHILESEAYDLFGHTDNKMLKDVYADLTGEEKARRIAKRQKGLFYRNPEYEKQLKELQKKRIEEFKKGDKLEGELFREQFQATKAKIEHLIDEGTEYYTYNKDEEPIIDRLVKQYKFDEFMTFIKEEE